MFKVGPQVIKYLIADAEMVFIQRKGPPEDTGGGIMDFPCGEQPPARLKVRYLSRIDEATGAAGDVRGMEFLP